MSFHIEYEEHPAYMKAKVTGTNSRETVAAYLREVRRESKRRGRSYILIDERLEGPRLDAMDVFAIASNGSMDALGELDAMAYVDREMGPMAEFAETVAVNRGMPVAVFSNVAEAEEWLLEQTSVSGAKVFGAEDPAD